MSAVEQILKKLTDRMGSLEQNVQSLGQGNLLGSQDSDKIRKALLSGSPTALSGWAGGDGAALTDLEAMHKVMHRPKTIGYGDGTNKSGCFGSWLQTVAGHGVKDTAGVSMPFEIVTKRMKEFNSAPGESYWNGGSVRKAPNAEGAGATGGYLVPTQFYMQLLKYVAERSFVKAMCTTLPMQGRELYFPYLNQQATTASSAAFPNSNFFGGVYFSWTPEGATYPQTNPVFQSGKLVCRDLVGISICSNQLIQDSAVAIDTLFTTIFADALAWQMDYAFLRGNGVNQPLGILNAPGTIASTRAGSNNLLTSLSDMIGHAMNVGFEWKNYCWVISQSVLPYLIRLTNAATNSPFLIFMNPAPSTGTPISAQWPMTLFGIPVYITEKLPAYTTQGDICLLDMSKYLCGDRMSIQVEASQWPYFTSNQMVWRTIARFDGQPWFNNYTTLADGTTTVSPHVILAA